MPGPRVVTLGVVACIAITACKRDRDSAMASTRPGIYGPALGTLDFTTADT